MSDNEKFYLFYSGTFSQWARIGFKIDGIYYNTAEQWMMASKARLFNDRKTLAKIMDAKTPREQKDLGREVRNFNETTWKSVARSIVYHGNMAKFTQNQHAKEELLATKGTTLVEASRYDRVWGIGLDAKDPRAKDRSQWLGKNWLGETLTKVRDRIIEIESVGNRS